MAIRLVGNFSPILKLMELNLPPKIATLKLPAAGFAFHEIAEIDP